MFRCVQHALQTKLLLAELAVGGFVCAKCACCAYTANESNIWRANLKKGNSYAWNPIFIKPRKQSALAAAFELKRKF
jgi:hypothetical protein